MNCNLTPNSLIHFNADALLLHQQYLIHSANYKECTGFNYLYGTMKLSPCRIWYNLQYLIVACIVQSDIFFSNYCDRSITKVLKMYLGHSSMLHISVYHPTFKNDTKYLTLCLNNLIANHKNTNKDKVQL